MGQRESDKRRITLDLSEDLLGWIDGLKAQLGLRSRGRIVEQLLRELQDQSDDDLPAGQIEDGQPASGLASGIDDSRDPGLISTLDESRAIVLIESSLVASRDQARVHSETDWDAPLEGAPTPTSVPRRSASGGIQLPGFVRQQARAIQRSLAAEPRLDQQDRGLDLLYSADLQDALDRVQQHWKEVYGHDPSEAVVEAAMVWLARDIWPQSDHSDGRPFSWNLAQQVVCSFCAAWTEGIPSLERVIVAAGLLEDPFSGSTLALRIPNLMTRFVQRHRSRQKRTTSFEAIDQSMTVHGALKLLQLPTVADRPYSLKEIREAYREQAQCHHPDAGGSPDAMRRLNEAYQFLKERYRRAA